MLVFLIRSLEDRTANFFQSGLAEERGVSRMDRGETKSGSRQILFVAIFRCGDGSLR